MADFDRPIFTPWYRSPQPTVAVQTFTAGGYQERYFEAWHDAIDFASDNGSAAGRATVRRGVPRLVGRPVWIVRWLPYTFTWNHR